MDLLLCHMPACSPDAGILQYFPDAVAADTHDPYESQALLSCEDSECCGKCSRKKRRVSYIAYPGPPAYSTLKPRRSSPKKRGCSQLLTLLKHFTCCYRSKRRYQLLTRYRYFKQKKPYSAVSVHIERLTEETYEEDDLAGIPDLIEVVRLQGPGPTEAARALRKKLKYGNVHRQLRALTILDGLLQNGGQRLQRTLLSDGPLLERLRIAAVDPVSDQDVRTKCKDLFGQWVASSKEQPGLEGAKSLYNQLPKKTKAPQQRREQSKVLRETEEDVRREDEDHEPQQTPSPAVLRKASTPASTSSPISLGPSSTFGLGKKSKKDKKNKHKTFNLAAERPQILNTIAASSVASTNLSNALKLVNRESHRVSDDAEVVKRFETCKQLRRQILRYIQMIESDEFLGGLIHANEELITSLMAFEVLDKSVDDDSDSELEEAQHLSRQHAASEKAAERSGLQVASPNKPPRPGNVPIPPPYQRGVGARGKKVESESEPESESEEDEDDPFGDSNQVHTPLGERKGYSWKEV